MTRTRPRASRAIRTRAADVPALAAGLLAWASALPTLALALLAAATPLRAQGLPPDLDRTIEEIRQEWDVVGLAVAVVKDDSIVYAKGFGHRRLGEPETVDENSLFAIGSNSKAFTAAGIGILVGEERMDWDDPVIRHLPGFALHDPWVTRHITVRDLLCHRSGLGRRGDQNWYATDFDRDEVVRRIRYLEPNSSFRSEFGYQNTMFLTAGEVTEAVAGMTWDDWLISRIFRPLGMRRSNTSTDDLAGDANVAMPHTIDDDQVRPIPYRNIDNVAPAGSINSSVREMSQWLRLLLGEGVFEGEQVLPEGVVAEMLIPHTMRGVDTLSMRLFPSTHFSGYGLGVGVRDYGGRLVASHTGGIDGMLSQVTWVPEEELGVVVLTNTSPNSAYAPITYHIVDSYLALEEKDWSELFREINQRRRERAERFRRMQEESRVEETEPSLALEDYAGAYEDEMYGRVTVRLEDGGLVVRRHTSYVGDLEHWHFDTFRITWRDPEMGEGMVTFNLDHSGTVKSLELEGFPEMARVEEES